MADKSKTAAQDSAKAIEEATGIKAPSASAIASAQADGVEEAIKETAKDSYKFLADGNMPGAPVETLTAASDETTHLAPHLELGVEEFAALVGDDGRISNVAAASLLKLERAGKNRTPYVDALMKRLKVKSPYEITSAGPGYTNDVNPVTRF